MPIKLNELRANEGATKRRRRVGRGPGSGRGKTAGRGHKGQLSRSGGGPSAGLASEGGNTRLIDRLPKRGFRGAGRTHWIVNLKDLNRFEAGSTVDVQALLDASLVRNRTLPVKVLGQGALDRGLTVKVHAFSTAAKAAIEKAGGKAEVAGWQGPRRADPGSQK
jgi:large subunit ribosomal protein L15